jgi:spermidine/putrescine transport system substrate-binding protein
MKNTTSTDLTMRAALLSRRSLMKSAVALGAVGFAAPIYSRSALSA